MNQVSQIEPDEFESESQTSNQSSQSDQPYRSHALIIGSWAAIMAAVIGVAGLVSFSQFVAPKSMEISEVELMQIEMTAKTLVGMPQGENQSLKQIEHFATGPLEQRYAHAVLVNEISTPEKALDQLKQIDDAVEREATGLNDDNSDIEFPNESQLELRRIIGGLMEQYQSKNLDTSAMAAKDRQLLLSKLGWVGELAMIPKDSPDKTGRKKLKQSGTRAIFFAAGAMFIGLAAILGAFVAVFALTAMALSSKINLQFAKKTEHGFVYIETFAIWIFLFFGLQIGAGVIAQIIDRENLILSLSPIAFFGSLISLVWPIFRGIPFSTLRRDIGWESNDPFAEIFVGGFCYLALILPMLLGLSLTILLTLGMSFVTGAGEFESAGPVGHPIAEEIASGNFIVWILVFVSACIAAPIVEETMFRGVLYRYLRDATTNNSARWISVALSSIVSGLIFAMIHPQGLVGIPVLTTLAIGFSLVREWRNSLIGPMVMHAINNTIVTCLLLITMMS